MDEVTVTHLVDSFAPTVGGIERQVDVLSRAQAWDVPVAVLTARRSPTGDSTERRVLHVRRWHQRDLITAFERLQPHVVHAHLSVVSPFAQSGAALACRLGIPTVITVHSLWDRWRPPRRLLTPLLGAGGATWTAPSSVAARWVTSALGGTNVAVVPNVVESGHWTTSRVHRPIGSQPIRFLTVGRLARIKEIDHLVDAVAAARRRTGGRRPFVLDIVGDGRGFLALQAAVRRHDLAGIVNVLGVLDQADIRQAMSSAHLYIAPSRREAFGIAALEARSNGLPVLAYACSGVADFVTHAGDGILMKTRSELEDWLTKILDDPDAVLDAVRTAAADKPVSLDTNRSVSALRRVYRAATNVPIQPRPTTMVAP